MAHAEDATGEYIATLNEVGLETDAGARGVSDPEDLDNEHRSIYDL